MRYLELKDGWLNLDTMEKMQFGEFAMEAFNTEENAYNDVYKRYGKTISAEDFYQNEVVSDFDFEIIEIGSLSQIIFEHLMEEECKINYSKESKKSYSPPLTMDDYDNPYNIVVKNENEYINNIDLYIANILTRFKSFPTEKYYYNYEWHNLYNVSDSVYNFYDYECTGNVIPRLLLIILDLINSRNENIKITYCRNDDCMKLFISKSSHSKFCPSCSANYKKNYNEEYNNSTKGLIHKVYRYMNSATVFSNVEMAEFKNKALNAYENMAEDDFIDWVNKEHSNFKKESKKRKQILKAGTS